MDNMMGQSSAFINPWGSQQTYVTSTSPCDLGIGENLKNALPYRRHSLAQEQPVTRNSGNERLASYSTRASFTSNSTDLFGPIWNNPNNSTMNDHNNHPQQQQQQLQQHSYLGGGPSSSSSSSPFYSSPHFPSSTASSSSSSALSPSLTRSFPPTQDVPHRPFRRFSLSPIIHETNLDQTNPLSSVPEESFQAYRRHSLAGPLISSSSISSTLPHPTIPSSLLSPDSQLHMSNYQYPLPSPHTGYSGSNNIARHTLANNNNTLTNSNHPSTSFLPSMEEEECNLLPFKLFESVDGHNQQQQQQQQQQHLSFDQPLSWCMVEFKAGRAEIYYSTIPIQQDDWVIVEADRGRDLGKVVAKDLPLDQVHLLLAATNNSANSTPTTATTVLTAGADSLNNNSNNNNMLLLDHPPSPSASLSSTSSSSSSSSLPLPKQICRLATTSEITLLVTKRHDEQKALLICQTKSKQKNLLMDIVDAEYQWDRRKLTFYFIAERRVDFRELVRDLFKLYKTRIWMCSVNSVPKKNTASVKK